MDDKKTKHFWDLSLKHILMPDTRIELA